MVPGYVALPHLAAADEPSKLHFGYHQYRQTLYQHRRLQRLQRSVLRWDCHSRDVVGSTNAGSHGGPGGHVLVAAGPDPKQANNKGATPVYIAAWAGHTEALKVLLAAGADPKQADNNRCTPVPIAAEAGQPQARRGRRGPRRRPPTPRRSRARPRTTARGTC